MYIFAHQNPFCGNAAKSNLCCLFPLSRFLGKRLVLRIEYHILLTNIKRNVTAAEAAGCQIIIQITLNYDEDAVVTP